MEHTPPPRFGNHNSVNAHLTAGGSLKDLKWHNPYYQYIQDLIKKNNMNKLKKFLKNNGIRIDGAFRNDCGELFILYRDTKDNLFVTGDEMDWEPYDLNEGFNMHSFLFSQEERAWITQLLYSAGHKHVPNMYTHFDVPVSSRAQQIIDHYTKEKAPE